MDTRVTRERNLFRIPWDPSPCPQIEPSSLASAQARRPFPVRHFSCRAFLRNTVFGEIIIGFGQISPLPRPYLVPRRLPKPRSRSEVSEAKVQEDRGGSHFKWEDRGPENLGAHSEGDWVRPAARKPWPSNQRDCPSSQHWGLIRKWSALDVS